MGFFDSVSGGDVLGTIGGLAGSALGVWGQSNTNALNAKEAQKNRDWQGACLILHTSAKLLIYAPLDSIPSSPGWVEAVRPMVQALKLP